MTVLEDKAATLASSAVKSSPDSEVPAKPDMRLSNLLFAIGNGPTTARDAACKEILAAIKADDMAPFYEYFCAQTSTLVDTALLVKMQQANSVAGSEHDAKLADAVANLGETEVSETLIARAHYLAKIGDREGAISAYRVAVEKTVPLGTRIDLNFAVMRLGFFYKDNDIITRNIEKVKSLIDEGGDWDRRNRLKVYQGIFHLSNREFSLATPLLLASLPTFCSPELMSYREFCRYVVVAATLTLDRPEYKTKIVNSPEILEVLHEIPHLSEYANAFYKCDYAAFFNALGEIEQQLKYDPILAKHARFYIREMRISGYNQLLASYRSLTLESMAKSFGVSEDFIDVFIASGRIHAVIDKVGGAVETNRPDAKNAQYMGLIKQGDVLLNQIQKLGRVINI